MGIRQKARPKKQAKSVLAPPAATDKAPPNAEQKKPEGTGARQRRRLDYLKVTQVTYNVVVLTKDVRPVNNDGLREVQEMINMAAMKMVIQDPDLKVLDLLAWGLKGLGRLKGSPFHATIRCGSEEDQQKVWQLVGLHEKYQGEFPEAIQPIYPRKMSAFLTRVIMRYPDVFYNGEGLPPMVGEPMQITLEEVAVPFKVSTPRRLPQAARTEIKAQLDNMVVKGIIKFVEGKTKWVHSLVVVLKADNSWRLCVDLTKLNKCTQSLLPHYPQRGSGAVGDRRQVHNHGCQDRILADHVARGQPRAQYLHHTLGELQIPEESYETRVSTR